MFHSIVDTLTPLLIKDTTSLRSTVLRYEMTKLTAQANGLQNTEVVDMNYRLQTTSQMNKKVFDVTGSAELTTTELVNGQWPTSTPHRMDTPQPVPKICNS